MHKIAGKIGLAFPLALVAFTCFSPANAQQQAPPLSVKSLNGGVYWTQGGAGGNTGIIVGTDGVIVVDAKTTPASTSSRNPAPQDRLPTKTVANKENVTINGVKLTLLHYAPAHTSGDLMVYLPEQKIVFTGDIIATNQPYTLIHAEKHGSSEGWIQTVKGLTGLNADTYVPGHGDLQTKAQVQERLARVQARRDEIKKLVAQGKSLDQVKEALGEKDTPAAPGAPQFPSYTTVVYNELAKKS
jgi:alkyl sulfatase BDS1-like metallo-beta-lactamase superfamily hydrolase